MPGRVDSRRAAGSEHVAGGAQPLKRTFAAEDGHRIEQGDALGTAHFSDIEDRDELAQFEFERGLEPTDGLLDVVAVPAVGGGAIEGGGGVVGGGPGAG